MDPRGLQIYPSHHRWEEYEFHRNRCARHGNERIRAAEARLVADVAVTEADDVAPRESTKEEAISVRIVKKRQGRNMHALAREQNRAIREMVGLPSKEDIDGEDNSDQEHIRLNSYCIFKRYLREEDGNYAGKSMGN
ncbi:Pyrophosphate-energized vacuolar membrane proton pump [Hordeum vulgare]|nr:Pyrophosphate-energized vacuolar membrane proton pump [Hordeum vulgare]